MTREDGIVLLIGEKAKDTARSSEIAGVSQFGYISTYS